MAKIDLASLVVKLEAQTAEYQKGLDSANKKLSKFHKDSETILGSLAALWSVEKVIEFTHGIIEQVAAFDELAKSTGFTVNALSRLDYAASQNGASIEDVAQGIKAFQKAIVEASKGTNTASAAFGALGISVKDSAGNLKGTDELLNEVADAFASHADGATKAAVAQELFSKSGVRMIPTLDKGAAGLKELGDQGERTGAVLQDSAVEAANKFETSMTALHKTIIGVVSQALAPMLPQLTDSINAFLGAGEGADKFSDSVGILQTGLKLLIDFGLSVAYTFNNIGKSLGNIAAASVAVATGHFKEAADIWRMGTEDGEKREKAFAEALDKLWADTATKVGKSQEEIAAGGHGTAPGGQPQIAVPIDPAALNKLHEMSDTLREQVATFGLGETAATRYRLTIGKLKDDVTAAGIEGAKFRDSILAQTRALEQLTASKTLKDMRTEILQQAATFEQTDAQVLAYRLSLGDLAKVVKAAGPDGKRLAESLVGVQQALDTIADTKKATDALIEVNAQIGALQGTLDGTDVAKFDQSNRELVKTLTRLNDVQGLEQVSKLRHLTDLQAQYNAESEKAARIQGALADLENRTRITQESGAINEIQAQRTLDDARVKAADQLQVIYDKQKGIADEIGNPALIQKTQQFGTEIAAVRAQTDLLAKSIKTAFEDQFGDAFAEFATGAKSARDAFGDFAKGILADLAKIASKNLAESIFGSLGTGGGSIFGSLAGVFGGARAGGGPVSPGKAYLVNENTPNSEMFVPSIAGRIEPVRAGGVNVTNHFVITAPGGKVSDQTQTQIAAAAARGVSSANRRNN